MYKRCNSLPRRLVIIANLAAHTLLPEAFGDLKINYVDIVSTSCSVVIPSFVFAKDIVTVTFIALSTSSFDGPKSLEQPAALNRA